MKNRSLLLASCLFLGMAVSSLSQAQIKVKLDKPDFKAIETPRFGGNTGKKKFKPRKWLEIEAKFKVEKIARSREKFVSKVLVKWHLALKDPSTRKLVRITKSITHVNIPVGEDVYTSVYLSPSTVTRIAGREKRASKSLVESVGLEILYEGTLARGGHSTSKKLGKSAGWWKAYAEKIPLIDKYTLRNKNETPFKSLWWDRYAEIKTSRSE